MQASQKDLERGEVQFIEPVTMGHRLGGPVMVYLASKSASISIMIFLTAIDNNFTI